MRHRLEGLDKVEQRLAVVRSATRGVLGPEGDEPSSALRPAALPAEESREGVAGLPMEGDVPAGTRPNTDEGGAEANGPPPSIGLRQEDNHD